MRPLKCIIVDDEPNAADVVRTYINQSSDLILLKHCTNVFQLMDQVKIAPVDLIFLDVQLPQIDGIEAIRSFGESGPRIILTTAYQEYAVEAFELNVVDYLLKPFSFPRFRKAVEKTKSMMVPESVKYAKSGLSESDAKQLFAAVKSYMEHSKIYLNSGLRIDDLALAMNVNRNHLSQAINVIAKKTFWNFMNQYRIDEAKRRLSDQRQLHFTIEAIALDAGFNSISAFNTIFKRMAGITPSEFRNETSGTKQGK